VNDDEMARVCSPDGTKKNGCGILVGKSQGKRPLAIPRRWWLDKVKMDFRQIELGGIDWIDLAQDRDHGGLL
jgi:hypothetical protein